MDRVPRPTHLEERDDNGDDSVKLATMGMATHEHVLGERVSAFATH
jgi:hypothetical protein